MSSRELDVLRLLRSDLDGPAIARELGVSLRTVRTHTQHIYAKLGVTSRRAAVRRAHQLNLFSRDRARALSPPSAEPEAAPAGDDARESSSDSSHVMTRAHHLRSYVAGITTDPTHR